MDVKLLITKNNLDMMDQSFLNVAQKQDTTELKKYEDFTMFVSISELLIGYGRISYF